MLTPFLKHSKNIRFIQIVSNDGISNDPLRSFIVNNNWSGVLIEPVQYLFAKLTNLYKNNPLITVLNVAISDTKCFTGHIFLVFLVLEIYQTYFRCGHYPIFVYFSITQVFDPIYHLPTCTL